MKKRCLLFFLFYLSLSFSAQTKTLYLDKNWKETGKSNALYYRLLPLPKYGSLELLRDYYIKGNGIQMQCYIADHDTDHYVGEVFWYDQKGRNTSGSSYLNKTKEKKLTYYFDDGTPWKTVEYGDSLKSGKTIEYKTDGSILGEAIYKNGYLESGTVGSISSNDAPYRYNPKTKSQERISLPKKEVKNTEYKKIYYWKKNLKTAAEFTYKNDRLIWEKNFDDNGNLIQQLDSSSYFYPEEQDELKNGKIFYYDTERSGITETPSYIEYKSFPFSEVSVEKVSHILLYRGTVHFLEKHPTDLLYRETEYKFFKDKTDKSVRLRRDFHNENAWKSLNLYQDSETTLIPVSDMEALSKEMVFKKFSEKKWINIYLKNKAISEQLYCSSPDFMGKRIYYKSSGKTETHPEESALIYISPVPGKYMILRENGGFFIPKKSGDLVEIPNYTQE